MNNAVIVIPAWLVIAVVVGYFAEGIAKLIGLALSAVLAIGLIALGASVPPVGLFMLFVGGSLVLLFLLSPREPKVVTSYRDHDDD